MNKLFIGLMAAIPFSLGVNLAEATMFTFEASEKQTLVFPSPLVGGGALPVNIGFTGLPSDPTSDGKLTVTAYGNFGHPTQFLTLSSPELPMSFKLFDNNGAFFQAVTATITIPQTTLAAMVADGMANFVMKFSDTVTWLRGVCQAQYVMLGLSYEFGDPIPEPASAVIWSAMLGAGAAFCFWRRRKTGATK